MKYIETPQQLPRIIAWASTFAEHFLPCMCACLRKKKGKCDALKKCGTAIRSHRNFFQIRLWCTTAVTSSKCTGWYFRLITCCSAAVPSVRSSQETVCSETQPSFIGRTWQPSSVSPLCVVYNESFVEFKPKVWRKMLSLESSFSFSVFYFPLTSNLLHKHTPARDHQPTLGGIAFLCLSGIW